MIKKALAYLMRDPLAHADLIAPIARGSAEVLAADDGGVLLLERVSGAHLLTADTDEQALWLLDLAHRPQLMSLHNRAAALEAARRFALTVTMTCHQAVWPSFLPPVTAPSPFRVRPLEEGRARDIHALYSHDIGIDYICGRLRSRALWGAFEGDRLAGFIGVHAEGSMGMLEVVPDLRRRGVGRLLMAHLCAHLLALGLQPFSQFVTTNRASHALHTALGFSLSSHEIIWLE